MDNTRRNPFAALAWTIPTPRRTLAPNDSYFWARARFENARDNLGIAIAHLTELRDIARDMHYAAAESETAQEAEESITRTADRLAEKIAEYRREYKEAQSALIKSL